MVHDESPGLSGSDFVEELCEVLEDHNFVSASLLEAEECAARCAEQWEKFEDYFGSR